MTDQIEYIPLHKREETQIPLPDSNTIPRYLITDFTDWWWAEKTSYLRPSVLFKSGKDPTFPGYVVGAYTEKGIMAYNVTSKPVSWEDCLKQCEDLVEWLKRPPEGGNQIERLEWVGKGNKIRSRGA